MRNNRNWQWFCLSLLIVFLALAATTVVASSPSSVETHEPVVEAGPPGDEAPLLPSTGSAPASVADGLLVAPALPGDPGAIVSVSGSEVTTGNCYQPDKAQTLCFTVHNGSDDGEWLDRVRLTFPNYAGLGPWPVGCNLQDPQDSNGYAVALTCSTTPVNEVTYVDGDGGAGEISSGGATWGLCVDVTIPSGYNGIRYVQWGLSGDEAPGTALPHDVTGSTELQMCGPLMLGPASRVVEGCNGITQTHDFELWNNTGATGTITLSWDIPSGNGHFSSPPAFDLADGEAVSFTTELMPDLCLGAGDQVVVTLVAEGLGHSDSATLIKTIGDFCGWEQRAPSPKPAMDNAVAWAVVDGGLWSVGGYGSDRSVQRYDPAADTWTITYTQQMTPAIEYPVDGCYGLDEDNHEVVVLFPDTVYTGTLQRYDITDNTWDAPAIPSGYPPEGRWAHDVTSLYAPTGENVCFLSGGSTREGGGRVRDLWSYYPATNTTNYLGSFSQQVLPFDFHASWYVPWVGASGSICVGGGVDHNHQFITATQCYDLAAGTFNLPNADLGPLPEPWWGMADGWKEHNALYQIWIANGVAKDGTLIGKSAYADETTGGFVYGPEPAVEHYRLEGDGWMGHLYLEQGSKGGFSYSSDNEALVQCPQCVEWDKRVNGEAWDPAVAATVETSDTIEIVDVLRTNQPLKLSKDWNLDELQLVGWSTDPGGAGTLVGGPGYLVWDLPPGVFQVVTLTTWFHVEPCTWTATALTETLGLGQEVLEQRVVQVEKRSSELWIDSYYDLVAFAGESAFLTLEYGNAGGYENGVWISNTFPVEAPMVWSDPAPDAQDPGGAWARWDVGDLATGGAGSIVVEVAIESGLIPPTTLVVWDGIFDHTDMVRDEAITEFHVEGEPEAVWEKWVEDMPWHPGMTVTVETSQTVTVVDVVKTLAPFVLEENWDGELLVLENVQAEVGAVTATVGHLEWVVGPGEPEEAALTKVFHVADCTWPQVELWEGLWVDDVPQEPRVVALSKAQPELHIRALHDPDVVSGWPASFELEFGNAGGFESRAWISTTFPAEAPFVGSDPPPTEVGPEGRWALWGLGAVARDEQGVIVVTVEVVPGLPVSTTIGIPLTIYNHIDEARGEAFVEFHVGPPPAPEWTKWANGEPWSPDLVVSAQTSDTLEVVDVFLAEHEFILSETWTPEELALTDWHVNPDVGEAHAEDSFLEWIVPAFEDPQLITVTKTFHVEPCVWEATMLKEWVTVAGEIVEKRPVFVAKMPPELWIESAYEPEVAPGQAAMFTLEYGNAGGYENDVWIGNEFPSDAPFAWSDPPPVEISTDGRWVQWAVGDLAQGAGGSIVVTVTLTDTLPYSTTVGIWDGIFNHVDALQDDTVIRFTIPPARLFLPLVMRNDGA